VSLLSQPRQRPGQRPLIRLADAGPTVRAGRDAAPVHGLQRPTTKAATRAMGPCVGRATTGNIVSFLRPPTAAVLSPSMPPRVVYAALLGIVPEGPRPARGAVSLQCGAASLLDRRVVVGHFVVLFPSVATLCGKIAGRTSTPIVSPTRTISASVPLSRRLPQSATMTTTGRSHAHAVWKSIACCHQIASKQRNHRQTHHPSFEATRHHPAMPCAPESC
jgi:hypothetical protein